MEITEVRIKLMENPEDRLRGFCSVTFDGAFVIRDLKIIEGNNGPFVAMPSRKLTANCRKCRSKNHLKANYCNQCGSKVQHDRVQHDNNGRAKLYADIAHPINAKCREMIQKRIVAELEKELRLAKEPGYRSRYDEAYDDASSPVRQRTKKRADVSSAVSAEKQNLSAADDLNDASKTVGPKEAKSGDENLQRRDEPSSVANNAIDGQPPAPKGSHLASARASERHAEPILATDKTPSNHLPSEHSSSEHSPAEHSSIANSVEPMMGSSRQQEPGNVPQNDSFGAGIFDG